MDDGVRVALPDQRQQPVVVLGDVEVVEAISRAGDLAPGSSRSTIGAIGVSESTPSSLSILRRDRLSTIVTSWPRRDRCSESASRRSRHRPEQNLHELRSLKSTVYQVGAGGRLPNKKSA